MLYLRAYLTSTGFHDRLRKYRDRIAKDYVTSVSYKKKAIFDPYMYLRPREIDELYIDIGSEVIDEWSKLYDIVSRYLSSRELTKESAQM